MKVYEDHYSVQVSSVEVKTDLKEISRDELICLYCFVISLIKSGLPSDYCFSNYGEGRVCIYKNDNFWYLYFTENSVRDGMVIYDNCLECCIHAINLIIKNNEMRDIAVGILRDMLCLKFDDNELNEFVKYFWSDYELLTLDDKRAYRDYRRKLSSIYKKY